MTRLSLFKRKTTTIITERKQGHTNTSLVLDLKKCTGCNLCWTVCPRYAIERGPIGASLRNKVESPPIRINHYKCVFCGLCAYICPFNALTLMINNMPSEKIKRGEVLPYLEGPEIYCLRTGYSTKKIFEGKIEVDNSICSGGCSTCIDVCPVQCLYLPIASKEKPWEKTNKIGVNREKCLFCGVCLFACPTRDAIKLKRTKIMHSKEGSDSSLWKNLEEKLKKPVASREWFYEARIKSSPGGELKLPPKRKKQKV